MTNITSGALVHHLMRPGTGVCIFGLVGDVQSVARCASAAAWLWRNDTRHSWGSFISQAQTSSSSGRVKHGLLPPDLTSPTPALHNSVTHQWLTTSFIIYTNCCNAQCVCMHVIFKYMLDKTLFLQLFECVHALIPML